MRRTRRNLIQVLSAAVVVAIFYVLLQSIDLRTLVDSLHSAHWGWVAGAAAINVVFNNLGRALRFRTLLSPLSHTGPAPTTNELFRLILATRALNSLLPARAGETLRALRLSKVWGYRVEEVIATLVLEPVYDILSLAVPALAILLFVPFPETLGPQFRVIGWAGVALALVVLIVGFVLGRRREVAGSGQSATIAGHRPLFHRLIIRAATLVKRFSRAVHLLNSPSIWAKALLFTWLSVLVDLVTIAMCLRAVNLTLDPVHWFMVLVVVNVTIALPLTPGSVGILEAGAVLALSAFGVDSGPALLFGLFYHAAHLVPDTALGALFVGSYWTKAWRTKHNGPEPQVRGPAR